MGNKRKPAKAPSGGGQNKKKKFQEGPKAKAQPSKHQDVPLPDSDHEQDSNVGDEDLQFVQQYGSQLGFLNDLDAQELNRAVREKQKAAAAAAAAAAGDSDGAADDEDVDDAADSEEGAEEYERRPRAAEQVHKATTQGLPVKTAAGELVFQPSRKQQLSAAKVQVEGVLVQDSLHLEKQQDKADKAAAKQAAAEAAQEERQQAAAAAAAAAKLAKQQEKAAAQHPQGELPPALLSLMSIQDSQARRDALKQQMALAAQHLLAEPEKHVGPGLRLLLGCAADRDGVVVRLALLSLLAVFKDVLPGYRIRSLTDEEQEMRVSKEVQALREFEAALLKAYQAYLKTLLAAATAKPQPDSSSSKSHASGILATKRVAVRCMGDLLVVRPGFNYSSDLLQALVPLMVDGDVQVAEGACGTVRQLLLDDVQGKTSLEAVQLVADLIRKRKCNTAARVVSCLLVLRFEQVTPTSQGGEGVGGGKAKQLSKKARRRAKKKSDLDRDFEEAEAGPDVKELALLQSQMLEALFEVFFRVLKHCSAATASHNTAPAPLSGAQPGAEDSSRGALLQPWPAAKVHRKFPLLQPVLVGLGRYSHLISVEYFNDLMAVLQELLGTGALPLRERLGVLLAALDILKGQGEALTIDRRAFYNHLYQTLLLVPLQVLYEGTGGAAAGSSAGAVAATATAAAADRVESEAEQLLEDQQALQAVRVSLQGWEAEEAAVAAAAGSSSSSSRHSVATSVLLLRCLEQQLLGVKQADMGRLAAFTKRLAELMLSCSSPAEALGCGCLMWRLVRRYPKLVGLFEWEGGAPVGGRQFDAESPDPSEAGALAAALWELPLLAQHYHPHIAAAAKALLGLTPGRGAAAAENGGGDAAACGGSSSTAVIAGAAGPQEVAAAYDVVKAGGFRPAPVPPAAAGGRGKGAAAAAAAGSSKGGMAARQTAAARPWCKELLQEVAAAVQHEGSAQQPQGKQQKQRQKQQKGQSHLQASRAEAAAVEAAAAAAAAAAADCLDTEAVQQALQEQYQLSRRYRRNQELRRELAVVTKKLQMFRGRLIQQREQQQQQQQQQVLGNQKQLRQQHAQQQAKIKRHRSNS